MDKKQEAQCDRIGLGLGYLGIFLMTLLMITGVVSGYDQSNNIITTCGNITEAGYYTLNNSILEENLTDTTNWALIYNTPVCLFIKSDNVILEGNNFTIGNSSSTKFVGIVSTGLNTTIQNINLYGHKDFSGGAGIEFYNSNNSLIQNVSVTNSGGGIVLWYSNDVLINNVISNNNGEFGFAFSSSTNSTIINSQAYNNSIAGVNLFGGSFGNLIANSTFLNNSYDIYTWGTGNNTFENVNFNTSSLESPTTVNYYIQFIGLPNEILELNETNYTLPCTLISPTTNISYIAYLKGYESITNNLSINSNKAINLTLNPILVQQQSGGGNTNWGGDGGCIANDYNYCTHINLTCNKPICSVNIVANSTVAGNISITENQTNTTIPEPAVVADKKPIPVWIIIFLAILIVIAIIIIILSLRDKGVELPEYNGG